MEEAYNELYQQFLRLRSLCLQQAALLHELSTALQKQQGVTASNGALSDMMHISVQCTQEIPACIQEKRQPQTASVQNPVEHCDLSRNMGTFSDLLAEDMSELSVDGTYQRNQNQELVQNAAPPLSLNSLRWQGSSSSVLKNVLQASHLRGEKTMQAMRMPVEGGAPLAGHFLSPSDGLLMSDVALQSHVCEFCQAIFPGDTTTRGDFLRHLYTHVT